MKALILFLVFIVALMSGAAFTKPAGVGGGHGNNSFGPVTGGSMPPGLQEKGLPPGLYMQNKIPHGWSEGNKHGWNKKLHSLKKKHHGLQGVTPIHEPQSSKD